MSEQGFELGHGNSPPERTQDLMLDPLHRGRRFLVYRVHTSLGRSHIVKTLRPGHRAKSAALLLERQARLLQGLRGEGIVRLKGKTQVQGSPALLFEDAGPMSLSQWLNRGPFPVERFLPLAIRLVGIVARIHSQQVIHRDINPSNVVLGEDGEKLTLIDFDLATKIAGLGAEGRSDGDEAWGTLPYVAPEQTGRMDLPVDHRADLYSLGATYFEMLVGTPPFVAADPLALIHAHLAKAPTSPTSFNPRIPEVLSAIILRLLAKMPDARYQSAEAVAADLQEVERQLRLHGEVRPFELGSVDLARLLVLPSTLYGRGAKLLALTSAVERVSQGPSEMVLLSGSAGTGKSRLVQQLFGELKDYALLTVGKFDELRGAVPYAPWVEVISSLLRDVMGRPSEEARLLKERALNLGHALRVITDLAPELELWLGEQKAPSSTGPLEAQNRLSAAMQRFLALFASPLRPLIIFLDDVQWADAASLNLLEAVMTQGPEARHMLWICAFRSEEMPADHPFYVATHRLSQAGIRLEPLPLSPLNLDEVTAFCADTLKVTFQQVRPLAERVLRKTAGVPLFVRSFLRSLHRRRLLSFDVATGLWTWDLRRIDPLSATEDVGELLAAAIRRLPEDTQAALRVAGCFRGRIELSLLAKAQGKEPEQTAAALWSALQEGLLVAESSAGATALARAAHPRNAAPLGLTATYVFVHDRVRQAAYAMLTEEERRRLHWELGIRLLGHDSHQEHGDRFFEGVDQLNFGAGQALLESRRRWLALLNFRAGQKAKRSSAMEPALVYFQRGISLLGPDPWSGGTALCFRLHRDAAECAYVIGNGRVADAIWQEALAHSRTRFQRADLYAIRSLAAMVRRDHHEAIRWARAGLALFGQDPPTTGWPEALTEELSRIAQQVGGRTPEEIISMPPMASRSAQTTLRLLNLLGIAVWFTDPSLFTLLALRMVRVSIEDGPAPSSSTAFVIYGMVLGEVHGRPSRGYAWGAAGAELARRRGDLAEECKTLTTFATHLNHWRSPLSTDLTLHRRALALGRDGGELLFATYATGGLARTTFSLGLELPRVLAEIKQGTDYIRKVSLHVLVSSENACRQAVRTLQGQTPSPPCFDSVDFNEQHFIAEAGNNRTALCVFFILRLQISYVLRDLRGAQWSEEQARPLLSFVRGFINLADYRFYRALTAAALATEQSPQREAHLAVLSEELHCFEDWAEDAPETFRHKLDLLQAEAARLKGHHLAALESYERSIEGARREGFLQDEALARELAGRYFWQLGQRRIARDYLTGAASNYARWGAHAKVTSMHEEFPDATAASELTLTSRLDSSDIHGSKMDLLSILKLAETISGELVLTRLLERLTSLCLETGGAQRGALVLSERGVLWVRTVGSVAEPVFHERTLLSETQHLPRQPIEHAFRTGDALVLPDAAHLGAFTHDPYVERRQLKSAAAIPIGRQRRRLGVLYLENDLVTHAFSPTRVRLLQLLSSEIAIALENAQLFESLRIEVEERTKAERRVRFLADASVVLAQSLDYETTLNQLAQLSMAELGDICAVDLVDPSGQIHRVAVAATNPTHEELMWKLKREYPPTWDSPQPATQVMRDGQARLIPEVDEDFMQHQTQDPGHAKILRALGLRSLLVVPFVGQNGVFGALTFGSRGPQRFEQADLELGQELALRASISLENARLYRTAQEAVRIREEFLSIASHELRTPLTSLQLAVESLTRPSARSSPEKQTQGANRVFRQVRRLTSLIDELFTVSRLQSGKLKPELERVDLAAVVKDVVGRFEDQLDRLGSKVELTTEGEAIGLWDKVLLERVVSNLMGNALKFGQGQPIEVRVQGTELRASLSVRDHGIGIPQDRLPFIFGRFERAVSSRAYGGLGLGLYIIDEIVRTLDGSVRVQSEVGKGSTFSVDLPRAGPKPETPRGSRTS